MREKKPMLTMSQVMAKLAQKGITGEFKMNENCEVRYQDSEPVYSPEHLKIVKSYRFEGESDPADNSVIYLAESHDGKLGMIIDSYGAESNHPKEFDEFIRGINIEERDEYDFESEKAE